MSEHIIDCSVDPEIPDGMELERHGGGGSLRWNPEYLFLFNPTQLEGERLKLGHIIQNFHSAVRPVGSCVLDYLLNNPECIPKKWEQFKKIFFPGTIFRDKEGSLYIPYIHIFSYDSYAYSKDDMKKFEKETTRRWESYHQCLEAFIGNDDRMLLYEYEGA